MQLTSLIFSYVCWIFQIKVSFVAAILSLQNFGCRCIRWKVSLATNASVLPADTSRLTSFLSCTHYLLVKRIASQLLRRSGVLQANGDWDQFNLTTFCLTWVPRLWSVEFWWSGGKYVPSWNNGGPGGTVRLQVARTATLYETPSVDLLDMLELNFWTMDSNFSVKTSNKKCQ